MPRTSTDPRTHGGVIATLTDGLVVHRAGSRMDALRAIAAVCDERGVKVLTLSTPDSILRDLQGTRQEQDTSAEISLPEPNALGKIGRLDLCEWRGVAPNKHY